MKSFDEYVVLAEQAHGHICAGQILGLRMAIFGMRLLGLDDPTGKDRKRLVTFVEIDRCVTDAVGVVTGCRLGKRALKFRDFGKVAATFCDLQENRAFRVVAKESSKQKAMEMHPEIPEKNILYRLAKRFWFNDFAVYDGHDHSRTAAPGLVENNREHAQVGA